jgi:hypothetical protein
MLAVMPARNISTLNKILRIFSWSIDPAVSDHDHCCGFTWLDKDELEILQCMLEQANQKNA